MNPKTDNIKVVEAKRVPHHPEATATDLLRRLFQVFSQDHGSAIRQVKNSQIAAAIRRASPTMDRNITLYDEIEQFLGGKR